MGVNINNNNKGSETKIFTSIGWGTPNPIPMGIIEYLLSEIRLHNSVRANLRVRTEPFLKVRTEGSGSVSGSYQSRFGPNLRSEPFV